MRKALTLLTLASVLLFTMSAMGHDKVVVIPLDTSSASTDKLIAKGRPGTSLLNHTDPNGYCTTSSGIKYGLSYHLENWSNAAEACPAGTWVCSISDLSGSFCPVTRITTIQDGDCAGTYAIPVPRSSLWGYLADATTNNPSQGKGKMTSVDHVGNVTKCTKLRAWCCWR